MFNNGFMHDCDFVIIMIYKKQLRCRVSNNVLEIVVPCRSLTDERDFAFFLQNTVWIRRQL